ncbi:MAG: cytochrome c family protein [Nitrospinota bacterium]|nr:cytochrome c family protein [Nitrospinota bacterium]
MFRKLFSLAAFLIAILIAFATHTAAKSPEYVGVEGCKCHKTEFEEWSKSSHGNAFNSLTAANRSRAQNKAMKDAGLDYKKDYDKDEKCLPCHTVGFGQPGGYKDASSPEHLRGVGCEMCHGAGSEYRVLHKEKEETFTRAEAKAMGEVYPPTEDMCRKCHDHKDSPFNAKTDPKYKFDFNEMLKLNKAWHKKYELTYKH